ncbi:hypothetical protein SNEBB_003189, partial [Seison nebaliae]
AASSIPSAGNKNVWESEIFSNSIPKHVIIGSIKIKIIAACVLRSGRVDSRFGIPIKTTVKRNCFSRRRANQWEWTVGLQADRQANGRIGSRTVQCECPITSNSACRSA